ncbi:MAG: ABC transporter substrate-binding protein [Proteobacteria bacterium]|nr:ABC transporter substrate-binding protein [Pseudomonadota bacterium]
MRRRRCWLRFPAVAVASIAAALAAATDAKAQRQGGDLVYLQQSTPPTLDAMTSTQQATRNIAMNVFEMLVARDEGANPVPDLATSFSESGDGLVYEFRLRSGVKFHNGKTMTAADAKGTFERYGRVGFDRQDFSTIAEVTATDPQTLRVTLRRRVPSFIEQISSPRAPMVVIPAEQAGSDTGKLEIIGTGPFQLVEWLPDSHVKLKRFDGYVPNPAYQGIDGLAGKKVAYVDSVTFRTMPEANARVAALETKAAHFSEQIPNQAAKRLKDSRDVKIMPMVPWSMAIMILNAGHGATANLAVRRAVQIAIDADEVMDISTDGVYRLDHGFNYPESQYWNGDIGKDRYNRADRAKAKALLAEAGYKGEEIVILSNSQEAQINPQAVIVSQQLKAAGINARVEVSDTPTYIARAEQSEGWGIYVGEFGLAPWLGPYGLPNFWTGAKNWQKKSDPELDAIFTDLKSKSSLKERQEAGNRFYARVYDQVYAVKLGDNGMLQAARSELAGFKPYRVPRAWGVSLQ